MNKVSVTIMSEYPSVSMLEYQNRPVGTVYVRDAFGQWQGVDMLLDSGNDITILTRQTAAQLGFNENFGRPTMVQGIGAQLTPATVLDGIDIVLGENTLPVRVRAMIMDTSMNLLGRADVLDKFRITFEGNRVYVEQTCQFCGGV